MENIDRYSSSDLSFELLQVFLFRDNYYPACLRTVFVILYCMHKHVFVFYMVLYKNCICIICASHKTTNNIYMFIVQVLDCNIVLHIKVLSLWVL